MKAIFFIVHLAVLLYIPTIRAQNISYNQALEYNKKCMSMAVTGQKDSALYYGNKAIAHFSTHDSMYAQLGESYQRLGIAYAVIREYDSSTIYNDSALKYAELSHDTFLWAYTLRNEGINHQYQGDLSFATIHFYKSLELFELIEDPKFSALLYLDLGNLFYELQGYTEAEEFFLKAISTIDECACLESELGNAYNGLGNALNGQGLDSDSVLRVAGNYFLSLENPSGYGIVLNNLGNNFLHIRIENDSAKAYYLKALSIINSSRFENYLPGIYVNLGILYRREKQIDSSLHYLDKGTKLAVKYNQNNILRNGLFEYAEYYKSINDYDRTLFYSDSAYAISMKLLGEDNLIAAELENIRFNVAKTEKENAALKKIQELNEKEIETTKSWNKTLISGIILILILFAIILYNRRELNKVNAELTKNQQSLEISNQKLERLSNFQEKVISAIGHDLRGYIANNIGLIKLLKTEENQEVSSLLEFNNQSAIDILYNLVNWGQSQQNVRIELDEIELGKSIEEVLSQVNSYFLAKEQILTNECNMSAMCLASYEGLNLVFRNLLVNASKYSPTGGQISMTCEQKAEGYISISISNEGSKISDALIENILSGQKIESTTGTNNEKGLGLGLQLVIYMLRQMKSELKISNGPKGPTFSFDLKLAK